MTTHELKKLAEETALYTLSRIYVEGGNGLPENTEQVIMANILFALQFAVKAEREKIRKYTTHASGCWLSMGPFAKNQTCTCGLDELLKEEAK